MSFCFGLLGQNKQTETFIFNMDEFENVLIANPVLHNCDHISYQQARHYSLIITSIKCEKTVNNCDKGDVFIYPVIDTLEALNVHI